MGVSDNACLSERDTGTKKGMLAFFFSSFVKQEKGNFPRQERVMKNAHLIGKFHSPDNSLLIFCSSPFRVEVQCQPQRGGTDRHEIHETAGY